MGGTALLQIYVVTNLTRILQKVRENDIWIIGLDGEQRLNSVMYTLSSANVSLWEPRGRGFQHWWRASATFVHVFRGRSWQLSRLMSVSRLALQCIISVRTDLDNRGPHRSMVPFYLRLSLSFFVNLFGRCSRLRRAVQKRRNGGGGWGGRGAPAHAGEQHPGLGAERQQAGVPPVVHGGWAAVHTAVLHERPTSVKAEPAAAFTTAVRT